MTPTTLWAWTWDAAAVVGLAWLAFALVWFVAGWIDGRAVARRAARPVLARVEAEADRRNER